MIISIVLLAGFTTAAEYCAFHVAVQDADGRSSGLTVPLKIRNNRGDVVASGVTDDGKADICDVGFGTYDVEIGDPKSCGQVVVRRLTTRLGDDLVVHARLTRCSEPSWLPPTFCLVLLHARDERGGALPSARLLIDRRATRLQTDSLGRVVVPMDIGETSTLKVISRAANLTAETTIACTRKSPD